MQAVQSGTKRFKDDVDTPQMLMICHVGDNLRRVRYIAVEFRAC